MLRAFWRDECGATAIEYALVATLVSAAIIAGITEIGNTFQTSFLKIANALR